MSSREVLQRLRRAGWAPAWQTGSHIQLAHDTQPGIVTVPHPVKDMRIGTLRSIEKQSGVKLR